MKKVNDILSRSPIISDGSFLHKENVSQYRVVNMETGELIYESKKYQGGSCNIAEFLGIVHALAYCKGNGLRVPVYSDSKIAIKWVKICNVKTKQSMSEELSNVVTRALKWVANNRDHNEILKWDTKGWGENPADFGRK